MQENIKSDQSAKKDKRATDRVFIPGATINLRRRNRFGIYERIADPIGLANFTKSGIAFKSHVKLQIGESIFVDIHIPGEKTLFLTSEVRWIDESDSTVGAQFKAFGDGRNYNPLTALEKLRSLQKKYS